LVSMTVSQQGETPLMIEWDYARHPNMF